MSENISTYWNYFFLPFSFITIYKLLIFSFSFETFIKTFLKLHWIFDSISTYLYILFLFHYEVPTAAEAGISFMIHMSVNRRKRDKMLLFIKASQLCDEYYKLFSKSMITFMYRNTFYYL